MALQVHIVEYLCLHILAGNSVGVLKQSVSERALAMVNVSHDAEVAYCLHISIYL